MQQALHLKTDHHTGQVPTILTMPSWPAHLLGNHTFGDILFYYARLLQYLYHTTYSAALWPFSSELQDLQSVQM
jgi:hypothetical protein